MWEWESVEFVWEDCVGVAWACGCVICLLWFGREGESMEPHRGERGEDPGNKETTKCGYRTKRRPSSHFHP